MLDRQNSGFSLGSKEDPAEEDAQSLVDEETVPDFALDDEVEGLTYDEGYLHLSDEVEARIAEVKKGKQAAPAAAAAEAPRGKGEPKAPIKPGEKREMLKRQQSFA